MVTIKTITNTTLFESNVDTLKEAIQNALNKGICLDNVDLSNQDLEGVQMAGASLQGANLEGANLAFSNMAGSNLSGTNVRKATFNGANLQGAYFKDSDLHGANFSNSNLNNVDFRHKSINNSILRINAASFTNAKMFDVIMDFIEFTECSFSGANLKNTTIKHTWFLGCDMDKANFTGAKLYDTHIYNTHLHGANFEAVDLARVEISDCNISEAYIGYSTLPVMCGNKNLKTSQSQRTILANFLLNWLEQATDKSEIETKLMELLKEVAPQNKFIEAIDTMKQNCRLEI